MGWTKFLDLMIEVVIDTAKGDILHGMMCRCVYKYTYILDDETYKKTVLTDKKYGLWMGEKVNLTIERCTQLVVVLAKYAGETSEVSIPPARIKPDRGDLPPR